jgi:hypothetical protein
MVTKGRLHDMIDALSERDVPTVARILEALIGFEAEEPFYTPETAPLDDEPEIEAERKAVAEARAEVERGEGRRIPAAEIYREFGV